MKRVAILITMVALSGCASTGPMQIGEDTYMMSARVAFSGPTGAKGEVLHKANTYCAAQAKHVLLVTQKAYECALHGGCGEAQITFMCLDEDDPRYHSVHMRKDNGVNTIEIQTD